MSAATTLGDLVLANRILAQQGVLDGYGHVSARSPDDPGQYLIGDRTPPGNVRANNIFPWTLDDEPAGHAHPTYTERFIHGQIYRARPDVGGIVHCHAPELIPYGAGGIPLRPIYHMAGFQGESRCRCLRFAMSSDLTRTCSFARARKASRSPVRSAIARSS